MSTTPTQVFVFGTLKEGFPNFASNLGTRVPGEFVTVECYPFHLVGERWSPWLANLPGQGEPIIGQVYDVDAQALARMDALERITEPDGYERIALQVRPRGRPDVATRAVQAYLKRAHHFAQAQAEAQLRLGPFGEYTLEHAALYRPRVG